MSQRIYHLRILEKNPRKMVLLFHRLVDLQKVGKVDVVGVLVATDNKNRLNGLSKNVIPLKIEQVKMRKQLVIDLE